MADSIEGVDELNNSIAELNRTLSYFSSSMGTASRTVGESTTRFDRSMSESSRLSQIRDQNDEAREKRKHERDKNLNNAMNATASSLRSFGSAVVSAEQGFKKYGDSIARAGDAISDVSKNFGILGNAFGGAIRLVTAFASAALGSVDVLVNFRDEVSKTSGAIPTTLRGMQTLGMQAGYSGDRLQVLQKITVGLGTGLQALGGVAGTGVIKFAQLANVSEDVRRKFGYMGVDQERLTELQAKYVQMQAASGMQYQLQNKSMTQLRKESLDYADNMTRLSALTGKEADTIQKEQEQVQLEFEEQAAMMADRTRIRQLRAEGRDEEANQLQREVDARKEVQGTLTTLFGPELASQMSRVFRTGFFDDKSGPLAQIMPELVGYHEKLKNLKPGEDADAITRDIFNTVKKKYEEGAITFETVLQVMGEEGAKSLGYNAETFKRLLSYEDKSYEMLMADVDINKEAALKAGKEAEQTADLREAEIALQKKYQEALIHLAGPMMTLLTSSMTKLNNQLDNVIPHVKKVGDSIGTWINKGGLEKLLNGLSKMGGALTWINDNKVLAGFGLAVLAFTGPLVKLTTFLLSASALFKGVPAAAGAPAAAGMLGKSARLLGKFALPVTAAMAAGDAIGGFNADPTASLGNKLKNAGNSTLSGLSFGLLGSSPLEIAEKAAAEKLNRENIVTHTNTVITDTKQRKENIDQNAKLAKETKEQMTEETRMFGFLTKAIKSSTDILQPFKLSIEAIIGLTGGLGGISGFGAAPANLASYMASTAMVESGGKPNASAGTASSARGLFQFLEGTWKQNVQAMGKNYSLEDRFDPRKSSEVMAYFTQQNKKQLESSIGRSASNTDLYMAHFMGAGGASTFLKSLEKNPNAIAANMYPAAATSNPNIYYVDGNTKKPRTLMQVYELMNDKMNNANQMIAQGKAPKFVQEMAAIQPNQSDPKKAARGGVFTGPMSGYPIEMHGTEMVAPLNVNSILMKLAQTPVGSADTGTALNSVIQSGSNSSIDIEKIVSAQYNMMQLLGNKLDNMIDALESSNSTQSKILSYTMV